MLKKHKSLNRFQKQEKLMDILFLTPQLILYVGLTLLPFVIALPIIFTNRVGFIDQNVSYIGFKNFISIFSSPTKDIFLPALSRTSIFVVANYVMIYIFGFSISLLMYEVTSRFNRMFFVIIFLPMMLSGLGVGMLINMLFAKDTGSLNLLLLKLGLIRHAINIKNPSTTGSILPLMVGWRYAGYNMALFLSGLLTIPKNTIDAAMIDGVNYWQKLIHIYLPQMVPSVTMASIFCIVGSFGIFDEPVGMGGLFANKNAQYFAIVLYKYGFGGGGSSSNPQSGTLAQAITMSLVVYIPLLIIVFLLTRLQKKLQY